MSAQVASLQTSSDYDLGLRLSAQGRHGDAIACFERALAARPNDIRVLFALGNTARALGLPRPAEEFFRRVLAADPDRVEALVNLANLLRARGETAAVIALLAPALLRNPESVELWLTLGSAYREAGDVAMAEEHYRAALKRRPDYAPALGNLADILADRGDTDTALSLYDRAVARGSDDPQARLNRAVLHLLKGNLKDGWRDYAARLQIPGKAPTTDHGLKRWNGEPLVRTRLLVTAEQGVGDQFMFASLVPELVARAEAEGGSILLECEPRLVSLFARSFPQAKVRGAAIEAKGGVISARYHWLKNAGGANAAIEMGSLPKFLRGELSRFPYPHAFLTPDAEEAECWRAIFDAAGPAPRIGICWRSGKGGGGRNLQYAPLEAWGRFLRELPGTIVSAQYDGTREEIDALERLSNRVILVPQAIDQKNELDRTCAMLSALDCVASAPTAVSWLAAGAGVPTFKLLYNTSWTSLGNDYEPFAPSCRCMMPEKPGDWGTVFAKTAAAIRRQFAQD